MRFLRASLSALFLTAMVAQPALAVDFKVKGFSETTFQHVNRHFLRDSRKVEQPNFNVFQRFRFQVDAVASENLSSTAIFDIDALWGAGQNRWTPADVTNASLGTDGMGVKVSQLYVDWRMPETDLRVRMGKQLFWTPGLVSGSAVLVERGYGISWTLPVNQWLGLEGFWIRARNDNYDKRFPATGSQWTKSSDESLQYDDADFFHLRVPMKGETFQIIPWLAYGQMGRNSGEMTREIVIPAAWETRPLSDQKRQTAWYSGVTGEYRGLDPWRFAFDVNYSTIDGLDKVMDRAGWFAAASAEYRFKNFTPRLTLWYSSGDDDNLANGSERMPSITASWWATSFGHSAYWKNGASHGYNADNVHTSPIGLMGVTLEFDQIRYFEKLMHVVRFSYERGTNSPGMAKYIRAVDRETGNVTVSPLRQDYAVAYPFNTLLYLTRNDSLFEFNFDTVYTMYDNMKVVFELGLIRLDLDKQLWAVDKYEKFNHKIGVNFIYSF